MRRRILLAFSIVFVSLSVLANEISIADAALMRGDYASAVKIFEDLAASGDATAMVCLASLYHRGEGVDRNTKKAVALYLSAAELGHPEAQFNLGNMYLLGEGLPQDKDWALTFYRLAARQGHRLAGQNMRELYRARGATPPDLGESVGGQPVASEDMPDPEVVVTAPTDSAFVPPAVAEQTAVLESEQIVVHHVEVADSEPIDREVLETAMTTQKLVPAEIEIRLPADKSALASTGGAEVATSAEVPQSETSQAASEVSSGLLAETAGAEAGPAPMIRLKAVESPIERTAEPVSVDEAGAIQLAQEQGIEVELEGPVAPPAARGAQPLLNLDQETLTPRAYAERFEGAKRALALENFDHGIDKLTGLAEDGYGEAALLLADMAERGEGMPNDPGLAMTWRRRAADLGNAEAQYQLAERYMRGWGVERDDAMAITYYRDAARGGHPSAKEKIGVIYADASLPIPNFMRPREPIAIYPSAQVGDESTSGSTGIHDEAVVAGAKEPKSAVSPAASDVSEQAQAVEAQLEAAVVARVAAVPPQKGFFGRLKQFFSRDAKPEPSPAEYSETITVTDGKAGGAMIDEPLNVREDNLSMVAQTDLAYLEDFERTEAAATPETASAAADPEDFAAALRDPTVTEPEAIVAAVGIDLKLEAPISAPAPSSTGTIDEAKRALAGGHFVVAAAIFTRLAEEGNADAQAYIGYLYHKGKGVEADLGKAVDWYRRAAAKGNRDAQYNLALAYAFGEGVAQDDAEAVMWYRRAAEQGSAIAQYSLGVSYALGEGVSQDNVEAVKWYRAAADQGYAAAQYNLGYMYRSGRAGVRDLNEAIKWYRLAAAQGHPGARADLASLNTDDI